MQSDVHYVGSTILNDVVVGPPNGQGLLKLLVPGTPDCRAAPIGDGLIGVEGQNCPFQMYTISGVFSVTVAGMYTICTTAAEGYFLMNSFFISSNTFDSLTLVPLWNLLHVFAAQIFLLMG